MCYRRHLGAELHIPVPIYTQFYLNIIIYLIKYVVLKLDI